MVGGGWIKSVVGETVHGGGPGPTMVVVSYVNSYVSPVLARKHAQCHCSYKFCFGIVMEMLGIYISLSGDQSCQVKAMQHVMETWAD